MVTRTLVTASLHSSERELVVMDSTPNLPTTAGGVCCGGQWWATIGFFLATTIWCFSGCGQFPMPVLLVAMQEQQEARIGACRYFQSTRRASVVEPIHREIPATAASARTVGQLPSVAPTRSLVLGHE